MDWNRVWIGDDLRVVDRGATGVSRRLAGDEFSRLGAFFCTLLVM